MTPKKETRNEPKVKFQHAHGSKNGAGTCDEYNDVDKTGWYDITYLQTIQDKSNASS